MSDAFSKYKKSGEILSKALNYAKGIVKPGVKLIDIAEKVEGFIRNNSAQPAFPLNISINEIAAHYSPIIYDDEVVPEGSIVKIDAGVSIDGYLTDAARTLVFDSKWEHMKEVARKTLDAVLSEIKPNESVFKVGEIVQRVIQSEGYEPIVNLSGHSLSQYSLHDGISIPNYNISNKIRNSSHIFHVGKAFAIEPFVTTGIGKVQDGDNETIFRQFRKAKDNSFPKDVREIYEHINSNFSDLPFSWRWVFNAGFPVEKIQKASDVLMKNNIIHGYPVLVESTNAPVTQEEETIFVKKKEIVVLTKDG